ncbi:MFS transporter [Sphingomonas oligophenolica]
MGLTDTSIGLLQGAAFGVTFGIVGLPLARLADNGHRRNIIIIGVVAWSLATMGCGFARTLPELFIGRMCVGIGEALLMPSAVSILSDYFSTRRRTRAISLNSMGVYLGSGLSLLAGGTLIRMLGADSVARTFVGPLETWRIVFILIGLSGFLLIPLLLAVKEPERLSNDGVSASAKTSFADVLVIFREKRVALFSVIMGFATLVLAHHAVIAWAPTLFVRAHGMDLAKTGQTLGLVNLVMSPLGVITGAFLSEVLDSRWNRRDGKLIVGIVSGLLCAAAAFMVTILFKNGALIAFAVLQFAVTFNFGLTHATLAELLPNRVRAFGAACFIAASNIYAATLGPLSVGLLDDQVFHDQAQLALSIRWISPLAFLLGAGILAMGLKPFRAATIQPAGAGRDPAPLAYAVAEAAS